MELIKCEKKHSREVISLYQRTLAYLEAHVNYPKWDKGHPSDRGVFDAIENGTQYICLHQGEALGALVLSEDPEGDYEAGQWSVSLKRGEFLTVHALAVSPAHQRRGVGSFMVEQCISIARQKGYRAIRLDIIPDNLPAKRLYEKHGFVYAGTKDLRRNIPGIPVFSLHERTI